MAQVEGRRLNQRNWKTLVLILAIMIVGVVVVAACGEDEEDDAGGESTATTQVTTGAQPTEAEAEPTEEEAEATEAEEAATEEEDESTPTTGTSGATGSPTGEAVEAGAYEDEEFDYGSLSGTIEIDGSSTVFPITSAIAEEFNAEAPDVQTTVGVSGTGGGFEKFCAGETDISNASRPIKDEEAAACEEAGIEFTEVQVAIDGISIVVNPANDWVDCITVEELNQIWAPDSTVETWADVNPEWPDEPIELYGPGTDSGTFDYFTDEINGEEGASRSDYTASEDDNVLVTGVSGSEYSMGYFGYAYYEENQDSLKALAVDAGEGCVEPTPETIASYEYAPLSRPIFVYVRNDALEEEQVAAFAHFMLSSDAQEIIPEVGYIQMGEEVLEEQRSKVLGLLPQQ